jgi:hypothetical protein
MMLHVFAPSNGLGGTRVNHNVRADITSYIGILRGMNEWKLVSCFLSKFGWRETTQKVEECREKGARHWKYQVIVLDL